ncbi:sensor histidine kinase [Cryptobacterium curtum]
MSSVKNKQQKQWGTPRNRPFSSIARSISWGFWWRRLVSYLFFNVLLAICVVAVLIYGYNQTLPSNAFLFGYIPLNETHITITSATNSSGIESLQYVVQLPAQAPQSFALGKALTDLWLLYIVVLLWEFLSLLHFFSDTRRIRRELLPLNDLALKAEKLSSADPLAHDFSSHKMESLEQAIERATIDSPRVETGDKDLASIEVALNRLLQQMQEAKLQQMRFVNDASHELRTPIAVIRGYADLLDRWGKTDATVLDESISALKAESEHMHDLVEQLLFLARGDAGRSSFEKKVVNLAQITEEVWEESEMIDADHHYVLKLNKSALEDARYQVNGDVALLKQTLRIIVQNAAKYSRKQTTITFKVSLGEKRVSVSVQDEGIGMEADAARHAFERFYRAENARAESADGSGLGLSIAQWIVDKHNGTIEVFSHEDIGTRFVVTIPASNED